MPSNSQSCEMEQKQIQTMEKDFAFIEILTAASFAKPNIPSH